MSRSEPKAIGYLQSDSQGTPAQQAEIESYCKANGLQLVGTLVDSHASGRLDFDQRPKGGQMLRTSRQHKAKHFIAPNLWTLFRDSADAGRHIERWATKRIVLHLLRLGDAPYMVEGEAGKVFVRLAVALGTMGKHNIRERTVMAQTRRKVRSYVYGGIPYGVRREGSLLIVDEEEQAVIKRIKEWRAEGQSYRQSADALNAAGIPSKKGRMWHPATVSRVYQAIQPGMSPPKLRFGRRTTV